MRIMRIDFGDRGIRRNLWIENPFHSLGLQDSRMASWQTEILEQFMEDEALHYPKGDQGPFFPSNHHRITPLVPQAPKLLPADRRVELSFHLLRLNHYPAIKSVAEFDILLDAYARIRPLLKCG